MNLPDCRYFHYDAFRGREVMRCRLLEQSRNHAQWSLSLCGSCPVPGTLVNTNCKELMLEAEVVRRFGLFRRVQISFAACGDSKVPLSDPLYCPSCEGNAP